MEQEREIKQVQEVKKGSFNQNLHPVDGNIPGAYRSYIEKRNEIISVIRNGKVLKKEEWIAGVVDTIIEDQADLTSILSILKLGKKYKLKMTMKKASNVVISDLLEKIFDPILQFKLTEKDIKDCFEANGIDRDRITRDNISTIYSSILNLLESGKIRDELHSQGVIFYAQLKIDEIRMSRMQWEVSR